MKHRCFNPSRRSLRHAFMVVLVVVGTIISTDHSSTAQQYSQNITRWNARLEALRPIEPIAYFELAEEIADVAANPVETDLARHLFALAGSLDPDHLGRSACLALADMESDAMVKRRMKALAGLLGGGYEAQHTDPAASTQAQTGGPAALAVCEAIGFYRRGQGNLALSALKQPGATELLKKYEHLLVAGGDLNRFLEDCKHYKGQLKPTLSSGDITRLLRFEAALLSGGAAGADRSWSSELLLSGGVAGGVGGGGDPLIDVDPARLEETLGVDAAKPLYRKGRWVER